MTSYLRTMGTGSVRPVGKETEMARWGTEMDIGEGGQLGDSLLLEHRVLGLEKFAFKCKETRKLQWTKHQPFSQLTAAIAVRRHPASPGHLDQAADLHLPLVKLVAPTVFLVDDVRPVASGWFGSVSGQRHSLASRLGGLKTSTQLFTAADPSKQKAQGLHVVCLLDGGCHGNIIHEENKAPPVIVISSWHCLPVDLCVPVTESRPLSSTWQQLRDDFLHLFKRHYVSCEKS